MSLRSHLREPSPIAPAAVQSPDERRHRLLSSPKLHAAIRKIAGKHNVPEDQMEDVVNETIRRATTAKLPANDSEVPKYVCGIAVHVACGHMSEAAAEDHDRYIENADAEQGEVATAVGVEPAAFETRDALRTLIERGERRFPAGFSSFLEAKINDETAEQVAQRRKRSAGHLRHEWADIMRFIHKQGKALGVVVAALLMLFIGTRLKLGRDQGEAAAPPAPPSPVALRKAAKEECAQARWRDCLDHLAMARRADPNGETQELRELRELAREKLASQPPTP